MRKTGAVIGIAILCLVLKRSPLTAEFNAVIVKLKEDGKIAALEDKWFSG